MAVTRFQHEIPSMLAAARRLRYSRAEVDTLDSEGERPDAAAMGLRWHKVQASAAAICGALPSSEAGTCVVTKEGHLFRGTDRELAVALAAGGIRFHPVRLGGAWPTLVKG